MTHTAEVKTEFTMNKENVKKNKKNALDLYHILIVFGIAALHVNTTAAVRTVVLYVPQEVDTEWNQTAAEHATEKKDRKYRPEI